MRHARRTLRCSNVCPTRPRRSSVSAALRSTDLGNGDAPVPLVANVVNLKFLYGIDSDGDGALDTWVNAAPSGAWSAAAVLAAPRATLARIKAVRLGIVVRSDHPERDLARAYRWVLFDCAAADKASCPDRIEGSIARPTSGGSWSTASFPLAGPSTAAFWFMRGSPTPLPE